MNSTSYKNFFKTLGPGLLFASTAIGVSHLVQSTRAGADYSFALLWAVVIANLLKYPFFEYGSRFAAARGISLIDGYRELGKGMLFLYLLITLGSMFFVTAAVGAVTAGFLHHLFGLEGILSLSGTTYLLFGACMGILLLGRYKALDRLIKVVGTVLLISTIIAVLSTLWRGPENPNFLWWDNRFLNIHDPAFPFLIALMGWMPTAVDLSAWNSLWTLERQKESGYKGSIAETVREFRIGYLVSALLAPCFMILGAYLVYGSGEELPSGSAAFADSIIDLYTQSIGNWSGPIIGAAAFSIMFGTSIGVFDGYARSAHRVWQISTKNENQTKGLHNSRSYQIMLLVLGIGALIVIQAFSSSLKALVDFATAISFLVAPIIAWANFKLVRALPADARPGKTLHILSYLGLLFLGGFSLVYLYAWWFKI